MLDADSVAATLTGRLWFGKRIEATDSLLTQQSLDAADAVPLAAFFAINDSSIGSINVAIPNQFASRDDISIRIELREIRADGSRESLTTVVTPLSDGVILAGEPSPGQTAIQFQTVTRELAFGSRVEVSTTLLGPDGEPSHETQTRDLTPVRLL